MGVMVTQSAASRSEQRTSSGLTVGALQDSLVEGALSLWNLTLSAGGEWQSWIEL